MTCFDFVNCTAHNRQMTERKLSRELQVQKTGIKE
jgi:hypothetical protein